MIAITCLTRSGIARHRRPIPRAKRPHRRRDGGRNAAPAALITRISRTAHAAEARLGAMSRGSLNVSSHCLKVYWLRHGCLSPASPYRARATAFVPAAVCAQCACACALWRPPRGEWACGKVTSARARTCVRGAARSARDPLCPEEKMRYSWIAAANRHRCPGRHPGYQCASVRAESVAAEVGAADAAAV
jgi:hypothetical protein